MLWGALYAITRRIANIRFKKSVPLRSKEGVRITSEAGQTERWKQHFEEVLNLSGPQNAIDKMERKELDINTEQPQCDLDYLELKGAQKWKGAWH